MPLLEEFEQVDFSVASQPRQILCVTLAFVLAFIISLKVRAFPGAWMIAVSLVSIQVGLSTLWSP